MKIKNTVTLTLNRNDLKRVDAVRGFSFDYLRLDDDITEQEFKATDLYAACIPNLRPGGLIIYNIKKQ